MPHQKNILNFVKYMFVDIVLQTLTNSFLLFLNGEFIVWNNNLALSLSGCIFNIFKEAKRLLYNSAKWVYNKVGYGVYEFSIMITQNSSYCTVFGPKC